MSADESFSRELGSGVSFEYIHETRFKTECISVYFVMPLQKNSVTANAVLAGVLEQSCREYPEYTDFRRKLAMLYGAEVNASTASIGNYQLLNVEIAMIDDRYIPNGEKISIGCAELLCKIIFSPSEDENGRVFRNESIELAKRLVNDNIEARYNDKSRYAKSRCIEMMCENEPFGIEPGGYAEDLPNINRDVLESAWRNMLKNSTVSIFMIGASDGRAVADIFAREFAELERNPIELKLCSEFKRVENERRIVERGDIQQAKMIIGMRTPVREPDQRVMAAKLMSMLYGGSVNSLLFNNVREKLSLCYYCSSAYIQAGGYLFVSSGLEEEDVEAALSEIKHQLAVIVNDSFTDEELDAVKRSALNSYSEIYDSIFSIERWYAMQIFDDKRLTPEQAAEKLKAVTRREIVECAAQLAIDTVYVLAPRDKSYSEGGGIDE